MTIQDRIKSMLDPRTGTYEDLKKMRYRVVAFVNDVPIEIGSYSMDACYQYYNQGFEKYSESKIWDNFINGGN